MYLCCLHAHARARARARVCVCVVVVVGGGGGGGDDDVFVCVFIFFLRESSYNPYAKGGNVFGTTLIGQGTNQEIPEAPTLSMIMPLVVPMTSYRRRYLPFFVVAAT